MQKEYIERESLIKIFTTNEKNDKVSLSFVRAVIKNAVPAADVAEVRHGRWEPTMTSKTVSFYLAPGWKCSCCGCEIEDKSEKLHYPKQLKYCWNCGAKMEKQKEKPDDSN